MYVQIRHLIVSCFIWLYSVCKFSYCCLWCFKVSVKMPKKSSVKMPMQYAVIFLVQVHIFCNMLFEAVSYFSNKVVSKMIKGGRGGRTGAVVSIQTTDQGVPGSRPGRVAVCCGIEQVTFTPCLVLVKPRKPCTYD